MVIRPVYRLPILAVAMMTLLAALWGGLGRLGFQPAQFYSPPVVFHGPLMISGFLGTLIGLERAVALNRGWPYFGPLLSGSGALCLIAGLPNPSGPILIAAASLVLVMAFGSMLLDHPSLFLSTMGLGAAAWLTGNIFWLLGFPVSQVVYFWAGFLVLTIVGERLELARMGNLDPFGKWTFLASAGLFSAGLLFSLKDFETGLRFSGAGMIFLSAWLLKNDIARRTVRQKGLPRFIAICLLFGHFWLGVSGLSVFFLGSASTGLLYDAALHSLFLGFVFSMIFAHAPIIFPAITGFAVPFRSRFYIHLVLLHLSLILRTGSDWMGWMQGRSFAGILNVFAILLFAANTVSSILGARNRS
ncbi:MAG TPA: hypothetical protein VN944_04045 [Nitrospiria bacterium]|nr:hypothetical protein [Nitrospiria bacterium]